MPASRERGPRRPGLGKKAILVSGAAAVSALVAFACADDPHRRTTAEQANASGGACEATPGTLPVANCDDSDNECEPQPGCAIDEAHCGSKSTCLPIGENKGKDVLDFRIRRLNIATPPTLHSDFIQNTIVGLNIDLDDKSCGELGKGLFTWILRVDKVNKTLVTGGAPPSKDPFGVGWCFADFNLGTVKVQPIKTKIEFDAEGKTWRSLEPKDVQIPIFLTDDPASVVLLPISEARLADVAMTDDDNCIGSLNTDALDSNCIDNRHTCQKWRTAGALGGYITLENADTVKIRELNYKSLCAFLSGEQTLSCGRDASGKITYAGDYCSKDHTAGSCADSVWLAATFAASAAKIFEGNGSIPACSGESTAVDAGPDGAADAGADAPSDAGDTD
jgi:hypothetical protein